MNRAGGISIQMIVVAAIGVLVLSVLAYLVVGAGQDTDSSLSCAAQGGRCTASGCNEQITADGEDLCSGGETCCQPLAIEESLS